MAISGNPLLKGLHGAINKEIVIKQYAHTTVIARYPDMSKVILSPMQQESNNFFANAVRYAQSILRDPAKLFEYKKSLAPGQRVYNHAIKTYMRALKRKSIPEEEIISSPFNSVDDLSTGPDQGKTTIMDLPFNKEVERTSKPFSTEDERTSKPINTEDEVRNKPGISKGSTFKPRSSNVRRIEPWFFSIFADNHVKSKVPPWTADLHLTATRIFFSSSQLHLSKRKKYPCSSITVDWNAVKDLLKTFL